MSAIVLDASKVNSYVLPSLNKSENLMQTSYSTSVSLKNSLPSSFSQRSAVNQIVNQIYNIKKEINDIEGIIDSKLASAKRIESKSESRVSSIASAASKIGSVVGAIGGAALGASTGSVVGTAAGAVVGSSVGSTVGRAIVNTGAKIVDGATKAAKSIWNGIKNIGTTIWNGCKKVANAVTSFIKKAVSGLVKAAKAIWEGLKWVGKQILRVGATIVNVVVSLVEGIVSFIEAIGDAVLIVVGAVCSIFTFFSDLIQGIATGEWKWSATSAVWKKWILPWVGYDWTSKAFSWQGKWFINDWAYKPFKRGELGAEIAKGVGYYVGVIVASIFTAGAAGGAAAAGGTAASAVSTVANGLVAGVAELGKATQSNYNSVIDNATKEHYIQELLKQNSELTLEEATEIVEQNITNGFYDNYDSIRKNQQDNISTKNVVKIMAASGSQAVVEGVTVSLLRDSHGAAKFVGKSLGKVKALGKATVQFGKAYVKEGTTVIVDGDYNVKKATTDGIASAIAETIAGNFKASDVLTKISKTKVGQIVANSKLYTGTKNVIGTVKSKIGDGFRKVKDTILPKNVKGAMEATNQFSEYADDVDPGKWSKFVGRVKETYVNGKDNVVSKLSDKGKYVYGFKSLVLDKAVKDTEKNIVKEGILNPLIN